MPGIPPRPLCLPELLLDPRTKADYIQANPPRHGPNSRPPSTYEENSIPPSPSSMHSSEYYRHSRTLSPTPPSTASLASTHTSLSIHNGSINGSSIADSKRTSQSSEKENHSNKTWSFGNIALGGDASASAAAVTRPRATWSNTFKTKSWFGNVAAANEAKQQITPPHPVEIKLSPSMIAAVAESEVQRLSRPVSSPYPISNATRSPRIGVGLQYYTEKNPAPLDIRKQIPDPIDLSGSERLPTIPTLTNPRPPEKSTISSILGHSKTLRGIEIGTGKAIWGPR